MKLQAFASRSAFLVTPVLSLGTSTGRGGRGSLEGPDWYAERGRRGGQGRGARVPQGGVTGMDPNERTDPATFAITWPKLLFRPTAMSRPSTSKDCSGLSGGARVRKTLSTGSPSTASKGIPWCKRPATPTNRSSDSHWQWGKARPWPNPVEARPSRARIVSMMSLSSCAGDNRGPRHGGRDLRSRRTWCIVPARRGWPRAERVRPASSADGQHMMNPSLPQSVRSTLCDGSPPGARKQDTCRKRRARHGRTQGLATQWDAGRNRCRPASPRAARASRGAAGGCRWRRGLAGSATGGATGASSGSSCSAGCGR